MYKKGVFIANKKDGSVYYRSSFTYKNKHISLGSFEEESQAHEAYIYANDIVNNTYRIEDFDSRRFLSFEKYVVILNYKDNNIYIPNPVYLRKHYISYFLSENEEMKFSMDDMFYYISHKILKRGGHLYVNDYGMQFSLRQRYGIKNYGVIGKDYDFINGDILDYRYENISILNTYHGVELVNHKDKFVFRTKIHINGDVIVGYYDDALKAAIAYNKAVDAARKIGINKNFTPNYIDSISGKVYADIYSGIKVSNYIEVMAH